MSKKKTEPSNPFMCIRTVKEFLRDSDSNGDVHFQMRDGTPLRMASMNDGPEHSVVFTLRALVP